MTDWLIPLLQVGGIGAVVAITLLIMGRWLLNQITVALNSYVAAYAQQSASIDARIANLEKLAQEQAHLTRTVESIKDEIAAQAKNRDNRWEFRKGVYVNLLASISDMVSAVSQLLQLVHSLPAHILNHPDAEIQKRLDGYRNDITSAAKTFVTSVTLAPLATADNVTPSLKVLAIALPEILARPKDVATLERFFNKLNEIRDALQTAGRKDLWGASEPDAKVDATT